MISTQRLLLIFVLMSVIMGIVDISYYSPTQYLSTPFDQLNENMEDFQEKAESDETLWGSIRGAVGRLVETLFINPVRAGYLIGRFFIMAFVPLSILPSANNTTIMNIFINIIIIVRSLLSILALIEMYNIFWNKKAT